MPSRLLTEIPEKEPVTEVKLTQTPPSLWTNRNFNIFWAGQTFSAIGDAFALIALPLLVLQATGSVAQMGLLTGVFGLGGVVANLFAGVVVDRVNRRHLMIVTDLGRLVAFGSIPLCWTWCGPQVWLIYLVVLLGSLMGAFFQVSCITAIAGLAESSQLTSANGRFQTTQGVAFVTGPMLAGLVSANFGPAIAIGFDSLTFGVSAISIWFVKLKAVPPNTASAIGLRQEWLVGLRFLMRQPVLRTVTILLATMALISTAGLDLFIFHLKHDLGQDDNAVGLVLGLASIGSIISGIAVAWLRERSGFGVCFLGGMALSAVAMLLIGFVPSFALVALMAMCFTAGSTLQGVSSISLRQQITPAYMLGRVTSIFWACTSILGPLGAAIAGAIAEQIGAPPVLFMIGLLGLLLSFFGLFTPVWQRHPEQSAVR